MSARPSTDDPRRSLAKFTHQIHFRNLREWIAAALVFAWFLRIAVTAEGVLIMLAAIEVAFAAVYVAYRLYRDGRLHVGTGEHASEEGVRRVLAREMRRQADLLSRVGSWYVAPFAIGLLGLVVATALDRGLRAGLVAYALGVCAFCVLIVVLNRIAAHKLLADAAVLEM